MQVFIYEILGGLIGRGLWMWAIVGFLVGGLAEGIVHARLQAALARNKR